MTCMRHFLQITPLARRYGSSLTPCVTVFTIASLPSEAEGVGVGERASKAKVRIMKSQSMICPGKNIFYSSDDVKKRMLPGKEQWKNALGP